MYPMFKPGISTLNHVMAHRNHLFFSVSLASLVYKNIQLYQITARQLHENCLVFAVNKWMGR